MGQHGRFAAYVILAFTASVSIAPPELVLAAEAPLTNAALAKYGARVDVFPAAGARKDPHTAPDGTFDNNAHTRCVMIGVPYTFQIELPFRIMVDRLAFTDSDYDTEQAPKEIEIRLDDGTLMPHTLDLKRPLRRQPAWQEVPVGKAAKTIRVTILSNYEGAVNWGGLGDIAILTPENLDARSKISGYDPDAPTSVQVPPLQTGPDVTVQLPPVAHPGEHPRLLLTPGELKDLRTSLSTTELGKPALKTLLGIANGAMAAPPDFPDPAGPPAQLNDRGDATAHRHDILSRNCGTLGFAYALTGKVDYAKQAAAILLGYAQRYALYPEHKGANRNDTGKVMGQRLSEAMWLIPLAEGYDYIYDSGALNDAQKKQVEQQLLLPAISFIRRKDPAAEVAERDRQAKDWRTTSPKPGSAGHVGNWLNFYNAATMAVGAVTGSQDLIDLAAADFRMLLELGIGADGMWNEGAIGYQFFAISAMVPGLEIAARQGIDLWSFDHNRVKMLYDSPLRYAYPDGSAPGIGDSGRSRFGNWSTMIYDYAYLRYHDPAYAYLVNESPRQLQMSEGIYFPTRIYEHLTEPAATHTPSTVFASLGYAILRSPKVYGLLDYGPFAGVHGHYDKLNFILYAAGEGGKGDEIGGEPQFHRYEDPLHDEWTKVTVAHNTMTVDVRSQLAASGKLLVFQDTPTLKVMRAESAEAYPGALLDRTIVVADDLVLDLYDGRSPFSRTWDRTFRYQGKLDVLTATPGAPLGTQDGYQHLLAAGQAPAAAGWQGTWMTTVGAFQVNLAGVPGQTALLAEGPDKDEVALARQVGETAHFAASYGMAAWHNDVRSVRLLPTGNPNLSAIEAVQANGMTTLVVVAHSPGPWTAAGWTSDARVLVVRGMGGGGKPEVLAAGGTFGRRWGGELEVTSGKSAVCGIMAAAKPDCGIVQHKQLLCCLRGLNGKLSFMNWEPYDPTWLVELAIAQMPEEEWLASALSQCTSYSQNSRGYIYFVDSTAPNKPGSRWQFKDNILLYDRCEGDLVLDILEGGRVGGVEFLKRL